MRQIHILLLVSLLSLVVACQAESAVTPIPIAPPIAPEPSVTATLVQTPRPTVASTVEIPTNTLPAFPSTSETATTPNPPVHKNALGGLPFPTGTTWVYARVQYQQALGDPTKIITATNLITETVVRTKIITPSVAVEYKRTASLVSADRDWEDNSANFEAAFWYLIVGSQVFYSPEEPTSAQPPKIGAKGEEASILAYSFPLAEVGTWCPSQPPPSYNPSCSSMGRKTVMQIGSYTTPMGTFDECFEIMEQYNSGGVMQWFCNGIGVVAQKYDHSGSRFGFEDTLVGYTRGSASN